MPTSYDQDFFAWTQEQSRFLRAGALMQLDIPNLVEELESMGRNEKRELGSRLTVLLAHLLKWQFQPNLRSRSWELTLTEQRGQVEEVLEDNPSLHVRLAEIIERAYRYARIDAAKETGLTLTTFPARCPYTVEQILEFDWLPTYQMEE